MKIAVAGGTGFIGQLLVWHLQSCGDEVLVLSRTDGRELPGGVRTVGWDRWQEHRTRLEALDGLVNLSGESISQRWTASAKRRILDSRLHAVRQLAELTARLEDKPKAVVSGSAIGIYGTSEEDSYDETGPTRSDDFLSLVVSQWEQAAQAIGTTRLVLLRTGVVLGREGGALPLMALPYKLGVGGRVGGGRQWLSWVHAEDMVRLIRHCIATPGLQGPVNATAPHPARNDDFGRALAGALRRPHWMPAPAWALKLALGEMSDMLLTGQRVTPQALLASGFEFRYPHVQEALNAIYSPRH